MRRNCWAVQDCIILHSIAIQRHVLLPDAVQPHISAKMSFMLSLDAQCVPIFPLSCLLFPPISPFPFSLSPSLYRYCDWKMQAHAVTEEQQALLWGNTHDQRQ